MSNSAIVSSFFLDSLTVILYPARLFGIMPFTYNRGETENTIYFSGIIAAYSLLCGLLVSSAQIVGVTFDLTSTETNRLAHVLDKYVALIEIGTMLACLWTIYTCFIVQRNAVLQLAYSFSQVDNILQLTSSSCARSKKRAIRLIIFLFALTSILLLYTHYVWLFAYDNPLYTLWYTTGYYIIQIILLITVIVYWMLSDGVLSRIAALEAQLTPGSAQTLTRKHLEDMNLVYGNLFTGLNSFSNAFGPIIFVIMTNILITLIASSYVIIQQAQHGWDTRVRTMEMMWAAFHFGRLLVIVEPGNRLNEGVVSVRMLIAELLSDDLAEDIKGQLEAFTTQILLSPAGSFSPFRMINVNRGVLITVVGTVTTYVVLLLNFHE